MNKRTKTILTITLIILMVFIGLKLILSWTKCVMDGKPDGPYYSSTSIEEAKKNNIWLSTYLPTSKKYFSAYKSDSFELSEIWIEKNTNDKEIYWSEAEYENILNIYFKRLTQNDLHKFRLIPTNSFKLNEFEQVQYPDGYPRIRFLMHDIADTIRIEVIERNPNDSLAWTTEMIIDTITLIKRKRA